MDIVFCNFTEDQSPSIFIGNSRLQQQELIATSSELSDFRVIELLSFSVVQNVAYVFIRSIQHGWFDQFGAYGERAIFGDRGAAHEPTG